MKKQFLTYRLILITLTFLVLLIFKSCTAPVSEAPEVINEDYSIASSEFAELASKDAILLQLGTQEKKSYSRPDDKPKNTTDLANTIRAEHPEMSETDAFIEAINQNYARRGK